MQQPDSLTLFRYMVPDAEYRTRRFTDDKGKPIVVTEYRRGDDRQWSPVPDYTGSQSAISQLSVKVCKEHSLGVEFVKGPVVATVIYFAEGRRVKALAYGRSQPEAHRKALLNLLAKIDPVSSA